MAEFSIYALEAGGGTLALSPLPGRWGDYAGDLTKLIAWAPDCAVSMTGLDEMLRKDAGGFPDDLREAGIEWLHLPIEDFGSPADAIIAGWEQTSADLRGCLAEGGRVLVHCYGGCGRSGMIALRLMIDAGEAADAALARLRAVRPCAVETDGQMAWARGG